MTARSGEDRGHAVALAVLRATLVAVIFVNEQLVDARQLVNSGFFVVLAAAALYALGGIVVAFRASDDVGARAFSRLQPTLDVLLLTGLAYTSGGAFSDVRKAFFVIPLAAAFSERTRAAVAWSMLAVAAFTFVGAVTRGHPPGVVNTWQRVTLSQDLYLAWTGAAATLLAAALRRRSAHTEDLAGSRQRLVTHAIESVERERTRLAGALHDSPVQNLIAARHDLRRAERSGDKDSFQRLHEAIAGTIAELREEIFKLHPHVLDHVGLSAAIEQVARHHARNGEAEITVFIEEEGDLESKQVLFAFARELLANAAKHAEANRIALTLRRSGRDLVLTVADDGCGIADGRIRQALLDGHVGLAAVAERAAVLGGSVTIDTSSGAGTCVTVRLPAPGRVEVTRQGTSDRMTALDTPLVSTA